LDIAEEKITDVVKISGRHVSMNAPLSEDEGNCMIDIYSDDSTPDTDDSLMKESLQMEIRRSLSTLPEKEREVINMYYGIGMNYGLTLEEIGAEFNLTRERVRQIKEKAIRRLKHSSRSKLLKTYLGA